MAKPPDWQLDDRAEWDDDDSPEGTSPCDNDNNDEE